MKVGVSKQNITPDVRSPLSGYRARSGVSIGIHDDLYSRAIAMEGLHDAVILISVDVLALSSTFVSEIRKRIAKETHLSPDTIVVAATHTHSGPHTIRTFFNADLPLDTIYMKRLVEGIVHSGVEAWHTRASARVGVGSCQVSGLGANRRQPGKEIDREAAILRIDNPDGSLRAVAVLYGCHPTVLGVNNRLITADYPAATIEALERDAEGNVFALFFNGAEGNISIGRSSELSAIGLQTQGRTFERAWSLGKQLADAVQAALPAIQTSNSPALQVAHEEIRLEGQSFPPIKDLRQAMESISKQSLLQAGSQKTKLLIEEVYAEARYNNARELEKLHNHLTMMVTGIRIGDALFVTAPTEIFTETSLDIKKKIYRNTFIIGLANGYLGYLPTQSAYKQGGYEVEVAICASTSEERFVHACQHLQERLFSQSSIPSTGER